MTFFASRLEKLPIFANSLACSKAVWALDRLLCTYIHNPFVACFLVVATLLPLQYSQLSTAFQIDELALFDKDDFIIDIFHNLVNLVFIFRFVRSLQNLTLRCLLFTEIFLLILQEFGVVLLLFCPKYSLLYSDISMVLRLFIWWQILCPYVILICNAFDRGEEEETNYSDEKRHLVSTCKNYNLLNIVVETNNNMLPIFMAQSFATINLDFPFYEGFWLPFLFHIGQISIKFYIICRFILYELVVVVLDIPNPKSFSEFYTPVQIGNTKKSFYSTLSHYTSACLIACALLCITFDLFIIALSEYYF